MVHSLSLFFLGGGGESGNKKWVMKMLTKFGKDLAFWVQTQKVLVLELRELFKALLLRSLPIPPHLEGEMAPFSDWSCRQHFQGPTLETASFVFLRLPFCGHCWPSLFVFVSLVTPGLELPSEDYVLPSHRGAGRAGEAKGLSGGSLRI